jgi:hypothetical protein
MRRRIMPWNATGAGDVTVLRARGRRLTKRVTVDGGIIEYDDAQLFDPSEAWRLDSIEDLHDLIADLAGQPDACVVRGCLKPAFMDRPQVLRRIHDRPREGFVPSWLPAVVEAPFVEVPRIWTMIDLEGVPSPPGIDRADPLMVGGVLRRQLPPPFQIARCVSQLSSTAGIKDGLRAHLWFMLDRALARAELVRWLRPVQGVDTSVFSAVQIHYVADPVFDDPADDPCHERLAILPGYDEVAVPDLPDPERPRMTFNPCLGVRGSAGAERYAAACLRRLALAPEGRRHQTCVGVACCLLALSKAGLLNPVTVAAQIKGVMVGKGFDGRSGRDLSEIDRILEWAWQTVGPEGLPHV